MDEGVELVVVIPTSPSSSKTDSGCKSYGRFRVVLFFFLPESLAPGPAGLESRPGNSAPDWKNLAAHRTALLGGFLATAGLPVGPSGLKSGGAGLTAELWRDLLPTARFSPPINTLLLP
jgi:hypothetical protein